MRLFINIKIIDQEKANYLQSLLQDTFVNEIIKFGKKEFVRDNEVNLKETIQLEFYDQILQSPFQKGFDPTIHVFTGTNFSFSEELNILSNGFDDVIDLKKITPRGLKRMVSTNHQRKLNEHKNIKILESIQQNAKLSSLGLIAGGVAHELNNPLTALKGFVYKLKKMSKEGSKEAVTLEKIDKIADRMARVIKGISAYSRHEGQDESTFEDPLLVLNLVVCFMEPILNAKGVQIEIKNSLNAPFRIWMNRSSLESLFQNLISNSADSIEEKGSSGNITITLSSKQEGWLEIRFTDSGKGMSEETLKNFTDPCFTTKELGKGTGLGMGMVLDAVNIHKGKFSVKSQLGLGTSICILLPVDRSFGVKKRSYNKIATSNIKKIAIIESDDFLRETLHDILRDDFKVSIFNSTWEFLQQNQKEYGLILTENNFPICDAFHLAKITKVNTFETAIWLLSGDFSIERSNDKPSVPFDKVIMKPILDFEKLKKDIHIFFNKY